MVLEARQYSRTAAEAREQSDARDDWRSVLRAPAAAGHVKLELATLAPGFHYEFRMRAERDGALEWLDPPSAPIERLYVEGTCNVFVTRCSWLMLGQLMCSSDLHSPAM